MKIKIKGHSLSIHQIVNIVFCKLEKTLASRRLNVLKTIYINFRTLPFNQAIQFPIYVWGPLKIVSLHGRIKIETPIKRGMIELGVKAPWNFVDGGRSKISHSGVILFKGAARFCNGFSIFTTPNSIMEIGESCFFGDNVFIQSASHITIGRYSRIGRYCNIIDTDTHYTVNLNTNTINNHSAPIHIGEYNWLPRNVDVMKGCITNNYIVSAPRSVLNKDYRTVAPAHSLLAGIPAKLIKKDIRRIFNIQSEEMLNHYFTQHKEYYTINENTDIDCFCTSDQK